MSLFDYFWLEYKQIENSHQRTSAINPNEHRRRDIGKSYGSRTHHRIKRTKLVLPPAATLEKHGTDLPQKGVRLHRTLQQRYQ